MKIIFIIVIFLISLQIYSQGCADAGVCSIEMNQNDKANTLSYDYSIGFGLGENFTRISSYKMSLFYSPIDNVTIFAGLPFNVISGDLTNVNGIGDLDIGLQYTLKIDNNNIIKYSMSLKSSLDKEPRYMIFPSGIAEALPQVYHPSLGNDNLILVIDYQYDSWTLTGGALIPLTQPNNNKFITNNDLIDKTRPLIFDNYLSSASLERGTDLMLRVKRRVYQKNTIMINAGVNPLYRIGNNNITIEENGIKNRIEVENSGGLTINLLGDIKYLINDNNVISFSMGFPVLARQNQNDGLLRFFQSSLSLTGNIF
jgi:hypothetical protein